ncbi:hypothetical protein M752DRAFT_267103 [Aspergillus phoenicis ATCC 13157]|uniref:Uncharacterized protein n=1 Tax=Aspergillus phoenicis ATCC 13157 TaxID=1353007 RepID=A0A370PHD3_ASPPH|nr:hypothetical protein M752DRAFT_267103 [Aspergillus phoenicis ATCC 13157]
MFSHLLFQGTQSNATKCVLHGYYMPFLCVPKLAIKIGFSKNEEQERAYQKPYIKRSLRPTLDMPDNLHPGHSFRRSTEDPPKPAISHTSRDSLVVTHPTTNLPACGLSTAERTGSPVFHTLWSLLMAFMPASVRFFPQ